VTHRPSRLAPTWSNWWGERTGRGPRASFTRESFAPGWSTWDCTGALRSPTHGCLS